VRTSGVSLASIIGLLDGSSMDQLATALSAATTFLSADHEFVITIGIKVDPPEPEQD